VEDIIAREVLINDEVDEYSQSDDQHVKALVEDYMCLEAYMMSAPRQSYITQCSGTVVTPRATLEPLVMAVDTDSSLQLRPQIYYIMYVSVAVEKLKPSRAMYRYSR
jgi:hypothetical protein